MTGAFSCFRTFPASRELSEALIVNPNDAHGLGEAMNEAPRCRERMRLMRSLVNERNVYRCAVMWSELAGCTRIALGLEH